MPSLYYKVLGQSAPTAATPTTAYTVPAGTGNYAVVSTINITNTASSFTDEIRIAVVPSGESLSAQHYVVYNVGVLVGSSQSYTLGIGLQPGDTINVWSTAGTSSFSIFGMENS
jgi:hypothetical protein